MTTKLETMTPESPRWDQFADRLYDCMTRGLPGGQWRCDGDGTGDSDRNKVHSAAKRVMSAMGGVDIDASLAFFHEHGGHCDCEILFNVDPD